MDRRRLARWLLTLGALQIVAVGCDNPPTGNGGGTDVPVATDNGTTTDTGNGGTDSGTGSETSTTDTGVTPDTGGATDTGETPDTGGATDTGETPDTGGTDAGETPDSGPLDESIVVEDAQTQPDTGTDTGTTADGSTVECRQNSDCAASAGGPVCDTTTNRCVPCTTADDQCAVGNYCMANRCVPGCRGASDCPNGRCNTTTHMCESGCTTDDNCAPGNICRNSMCVAGCSTARPCGAGQTCCGSTCVNTQTDGANCGACGTACTTGQTCCAGGCVNPQTDAANCGGCGMRCQVANATAACVAGACGVGTCNTGFANCDNMAANGCEAATTTDTANCGACGTACTAGTNATPRCTNSVCGITCGTGSGNCDNMAANGCEVDTTTSAANCGACGTACPARANATPRCAASACGFTCNTGFGNCDNNATNGCETNLGTSTANCGACGTACSFTRATAVCNAGVCALGTCSTGFGNCDNMAANGCETNIRTDRLNCGACGRACAANAICFDGNCSSVCTTPLIVCSGTTCVDPRSNAAHCGACNAACAATVSGGTQACVDSVCTLTCNRTTGNCDNNRANGCETNTATNVAHCGACGRACSFPNAAAACRGGVCEMGACNTGFANCDGNPANGCETALNTTSNCGACARACSFPNATSVCTNGACNIGTCNTGFGNCSGGATGTDGCETNIGTNTRACGACGRTCAVGQACAAGTCVATCPSGTSFCAGGCVVFASDRDNCGACGTRCTATQTCSGGACVPLRPVNDTLAGAITLNLSAAAVAFTANTINAVNNIPTPCLTGGTATGGDVFYRFTLTRREVVYADTQGATFDTVLFFANDQGVPVAPNQTPGDIVCNDDFAGTCDGFGTNSAVVTVLNPGTWYLVVSGWSQSAGSTPVRLEHLPAGSGDLAVLPQGVSTQTGTVSGTGTISSGTCGGAGPEDVFWWRTCPVATGNTPTPFTAETCNTASFDTVLRVQTGSGFTACNDDAGGTCGSQSRISASYVLSARLHTLEVDSYATGATGTYSVRVNRP